MKRMKTILIIFISLWLIGREAHGNLKDLAEELQVKIFRLLPLEALLAVSQTSQHMKRISRDREIWERITVQPAAGKPLEDISPFVRTVSLCGNRIELFKSGEEGRERVGFLLCAIAQNPANPYQFEAMRMLLPDCWFRGSYTGYERRLEPFLWRIVSDPHHENRVEAAMRLFFLVKDEKTWSLKTFLRSVLEKEEEEGTEDAPPEASVQDKLKAALALVECPEYKEKVHTVLNTILERSPLDECYEAARIVAAEFPTGKEKALEVLRNIARSPKSPHYYEAARDLFCEKEEEDKELAKQSLFSIAKDRKNSTQYKAALDLWPGTGEEERERVHEILRFIAKDSSHPEQYAAAETLKRNAKEEDRNLAHATFRSIIAQQGHPYQYKSIGKLQEQYPLSEEDKRLSLNAYRNIVQDRNHLHRYNAACSLKSLARDEENREIWREALREIAYDKQHPHHYEASVSLWEKNTYDPREGENRGIARTLLQEIALNLKHPFRYDAVCVLRREEDGQEIAQELEASILQEENSPYYYEAARNLLFSYGQVPIKEEYKRVALEVFKSIIQNPNHLYYTAIKDLFMTKKEEEQNLVRPLILKFLQEEDKRETYANTLFVFGGEADKEAVRPLYRKWVQHPEKGENTAFILFQYGNEEDKEFVQDLIKREVIKGDFVKMAMENAHFL